MKSKYLHTLCALIYVFTFTGCENNYVTVPVSTFEIGNHLKEGAQVEVIQFSGMKSGTPPYEHLSHLIVVSTESNDTFNMLTIPGMSLNVINRPDDRIWNYHSIDSFTGKYFIETMNVDLDKLNTVQCHKDFKMDLYNQFNTVMGILSEDIEP